ncbi:MULTISPECIES: pirin-like C-terminal cupin domain-containing protein [Pseudomonas aeruginosa group]|nr:hypothetical protein B7D75_11180 [Pseudomonas paraeruginosa]MBG3902323.1 hypothetical protein [Pseudomonas aeruginosa]MBG4201175.1 hypothetical protein [Pseudomonas aeruginosa]MBG4280554.1 hypothetical protein [Pseudomonas aeruginosa]MBG6889948.1 hypothetical protein [Pseudomonas aeruginosa]
MRALVGAGQSLHQPLVVCDPFVMNTEEQIAKAYADFRTGCAATVASC